MSSNQVLAPDPELKRWEVIRRSLLAVVAQQHAADPSARYTLSIKIQPKEASNQAA